MIQQPELGKKIADLRKAKGLTQEELVDKCNLNVRTLQRIESGEVTPRTYTIRLIFEALDFSLEETQIDKGLVQKWLEQFYISFIDLFNLKTNTMKKLSILSVTFIAISISLFALCTESKAQKADKAIKAIGDSQNKINKWINIGQVDSILTFYREDACVLPAWTGKTEIREMIQSAVDGGYKLIEFQILSISVADTIAVQKYYDIFEYSGKTHKQQGLTEWRLTKGKWLIVNDIMTNY
jgi:transcriptional regulator with XRE-family HTH domain